MEPRYVYCTEKCYWNDGHDNCTRKTCIDYLSDGDIIKVFNASSNHPIYDEIEDMRDWLKK